MLGMFLCLSRSALQGTKSTVVSTQCNTSEWFDPKDVNIQSHSPLLHSRLKTQRNTYFVKCLYEVFLMVLVSSELVRLGAQRPRILSGVQGLCSWRKECKT